mmetsp:Transcript_20453/g.52840  ORF Transcript_20453/g.52840 Transcript_20453/m.52840 type:complete len:331 (+) Transcript_20453:64-1056(+)
MGLCASTPAPPTEREPIAEETGVTKSDEPIVEPSDTEVAERIEAEKKHEKLTPVKLAAIGVVFVFFVWMTIESIYEVIRSLGGFGDPAEVPMSALRRAAFGNTNEISSEVCLQTNYGGGCPLFKPMGECSPFSERFIGHRVHSLVIGHMVTSPHLTAKVIIDLIHVFGACSSYTLLFATVVLGGPAYYGGFKKLVMNNLTFLPWQMVISGSLLAGLRVSTDEGAYASAHREGGGTRARSTALPCKACWPCAASRDRARVHLVPTCHAAPQASPRSTCTRRSRGSRLHTASTRPGTRSPGLASLWRLRSGSSTRAWRRRRSSRCTRPSTSS